MLQTQTIQSLKVALDATRLRQRTIASNVANINTPGYKTKDVDFGEILNNTQSGSSMQMRVTNSKHLHGMSSQGVYESAIFDSYPASKSTPGKNDVDIDREMVKNSETFTNLKMYTQLLKSKFEGYKDVINAPVG